MNLEPLPEHLLDQSAADAIRDLDRTQVSFLLPVIDKQGEHFRAKYQVGIGTLRIFRSGDSEWAEIHDSSGRRHLVHHHWVTTCDRMVQKSNSRLRARFAPTGLPETISISDLVWTGPYGAALPNGYRHGKSKRLGDDLEVGLLGGSYLSLLLEERRFNDEHRTE